MKPQKLLNKNFVLLFQGQLVSQIGSLFPKLAASIGYGDKTAAPNAVFRLDPSFIERYEQGR